MWLHIHVCVYLYVCVQISLWWGLLVLSWLEDIFWNTMRPNTPSGERRFTPACVFQKNWRRYQTHRHKNTQSILNEITIQYNIIHHTVRCFIYLPTKRIKTIMIYYNEIILLMLEYVPNTPLIWKQMCPTQTHSLGGYVMLIAWFNMT